MLAVRFKLPLGRALEAFELARTPGVLEVLLDATR